MHILFIGDIVGKSGRQALSKHLQKLRKMLTLDVVIANGENATAGFGLSGSKAEELFEIGVDIITLGNHAWDQQDMLSYIERDDRILRPLNYPNTHKIPGRGAYLYTIGTYRVLVITVLGQIFMNSLNDPFSAVDEQLELCQLGFDADAILVECHGEASSEKMSMGHFCDGKVSFVVGTHTHIPTADAQILDGGTAYLTDAGMTGDYNSVIGMRKDEPVQRFSTRLPSKRLQPALGEGSLCGFYVETDSKTGLAKTCSPVRIGGRLQTCLPSLNRSD